MSTEKTDPKQGLPYSTVQVSKSTSMLLKRAAVTKLPKYGEQSYREAEHVLVVKAHTQIVHVLAFIFNKEAVLGHDSLTLGEKKAQSLFLRHDHKKAFNPNWFEFVQLAEGRPSRLDRGQQQ